MKFFTKPVQIALVAIAGIVTLFFGMEFLKGVSFTSDDNSYYVTFKDVSGLTSSSPIYANGYKVGMVSDIEYDLSHVKDTRVLIKLDKGMSVTKGSSAEIASDMLGNVKVNLLINTATQELLPAGSTIPGGFSIGAIDKFTALIPHVEKMLPKLDSILASLNLILANPAINQSLNNVQTVTGNLTTSTEELNRLLASLNKEVPGIVRKTNKVLDNTERLTSNLANVDIDKTMSDVNATVANVKEITNKLNNNNGTLGKLMNDDHLYNNMNSTVRSADSLMRDLKQHPKRYVHFSVFGKKDK
jgi:phospholipid/cholesterol/gamma-HCH transport system substrate-binding protein